MNTKHLLIGSHAAAVTWLRERPHVNPFETREIHRYDQLLGLDHLDPPYVWFLHDADDLDDILGIRMQVKIIEARSQ
jgi:hypothetical protein